MANTRTPLYVAGLELVNIKCFAKASLRFDPDGTTPWAVIVGDNATGKTVLLRSLALGLCDQTSAAGLMKESDEGYIRRPVREGSIVVDLFDRDAPQTTYRIRTTLTKIDTGETTFERLEQETEPREGFPWERIFACAYGMGRAISGTGDVAGYSVINAVYNLFSYSEGLQNPELSLRRLEDKAAVQMWLSSLATVLPVRESGIHLLRSLTFDGRWGDEMPFRDLADGVRGTFLWTADLVGWAIAYNGAVDHPSKIRGVVLIDELEQHLHATWQRDIVSKLQNLFPGIQFIATTHSPLIASSIGSLGRPTTRDKLYLCELDDDSQEVRIDSLETMQTYRFEQVLASRAFKYLIEANPALEGALRRASELADKGADRSPSEEREYSELKKQLADAEFLWSASSAQREIEQEELSKLKDLVRREEESVERKDDQD
ncbi:MAG: AAA family ATPase [Acidobacteriota bacterium]